MEMTHVKAYAEAATRKDLEGMLLHMADDIVLNTPLAAESVKGKAAISQILGPLLKVVNKFDFQEFMQGPAHVSSFFKLTSGTIQLDGMDYWRLDETGLIKEMTVFWRPLPEASQVQKKLG
jgi:hypothetical protein